LNATILPVKRIADIPTQSPQTSWLIENIWGLDAVGIVGGAPKCCKSWFALDLAISVASGTPCLDHFEVHQKGPTLVYLAEDAAPRVRERVLGICRHRKVDIDTLDLHLIDTPSLRLDLESDRNKLRAAVHNLKPKLLILDPLVRLHRADENSSAEISAILGFLREIQRAFHTAVILVHHMSKKSRAHLGQSLRGSGDLHAFGDCNAYLVKNNRTLQLSVEHRFAPSNEPIPIALVSNKDGTQTHLEPLNEKIEQSISHLSLAERVRKALSQVQAPMTRVALRSLLKVNNQKLGDALELLEQQMVIKRTNDGWMIAASNQKPIQTLQKVKARTASQIKLF
jgi:hypothetical protein